MLCKLSYNGTIVNVSKEYIVLCVYHCVCIYIYIYVYLFLYIQFLEHVYETSLMPNE
jgi:hypothetical protein